VKLGVPMRGSCLLLSREILEVMTGVLESKLEIEKARTDRRTDAALKLPVETKRAF
jgi:hypothetical protein